MRIFPIPLFCLAMVLASPSVGLSGQSNAPEQQVTSAAENLVGAWRLVSIETKRSNDEVIYPVYGYGKHPDGVLIYDRSGWMSVQIVSDPKPTVPKGSSRESFLGATATDQAAAAAGYYAYCGTWTVDPSSSTVTHHIRQSLYPGERGEDGVRRFTLKGNRLTLTAKVHEMGEDHERVLVWERLEPVQH